MNTFRPETDDKIGKKISIRKLGFDWNRDLSEQIESYKNDFFAFNRLNDNYKTVDIYGIRDYCNNFSIVGIESQNILLKNNAICMIEEISPSDALNYFAESSTGLSSINVTEEELSEHDIRIFDEFLDSITISIGNESRTFLVQ